MTKDIFLTLKSIKYSGKSIGEDIRIEIESVGQLFEENYTIRRGTIRNLEEHVGVFRVDQSSFKLPVTIRVIERDKILNDVGIKKIKMKFDVNSYKVQKSTIRVKVKESRWLIVHPEAVFDVALEVRVIEAMRYITEADQGWLEVIMERSGNHESLPSFLKVRFDKRENKRDYFTILEGLHSNERASVKIGKDGGSFLVAGTPQSKAIFLTYSKSKETLTVNGKEYKAVDDPDRPWKKGLYDIEIPDAPHKKARQYLKKASKALVWFHIGHERNPKLDDENYIHTGKASLGCITLTEHDRWDEVYEALIRARKGDSQSIGVLEVID